MKFHFTDGTCITDIRGTRVTLTLVENTKHPAANEVFRCQSIMAEDYKTCA
jgi:hypothetical protein